MTKSVANPCSVTSYWDKGGRPPVCNRKPFEQKYKEYLAQNLGMMVGLDKVKGWLKEMKEELIINDSGVPTDDDSKVSESTISTYSLEVRVGSKLEEHVNGGYRYNATHAGPSR